MDSREALIALNLIEHIGSVRARLRLEHFSDTPEFLAAALPLDSFPKSFYCLTNG